MSALEANLNANENVLQAAGRLIVRYGLVLILLWIGAMKFTGYEAMGIESLVASSPLMSWLYKILSLQAVSNMLGFERGLHVNELDGHVMELVQR
jgi:uncharacterized membrane protein YkgB